MRVRVMAAALLVLGLGATGCGSSGGGGGGGPTTLRLGYFPNITHATALVGMRLGLFQQALGAKVQLSTVTFNAGPAALEALFSGAVDASYVGPNPAINGFIRSGGSAIRVVSGAATGGAELVVKKSIATVAQLRGKRIATPQLGNTQDVALRYWLQQHGLRTDTSGGGGVSIQPQDNSQTVDTFATGAVDGAWVPEPYASRLVGEGGHVLVDERSLWPGGRFATTVLVVRTAYLQAHPEVIQRLLTAQVTITDYLKAHPAQAQQAANAQILALTGKKLTAKVLTRAWGELTFTDDPVALSIVADAQHARSLGLLGSTSLSGLFALGPLNTVLRAHNEPAVSSA